MNVAKARMGASTRALPTTALLKIYPLLVLISVSFSSAHGAPKTVAELQLELARCSRAWGEAPTSTDAPLCEARAHLALGHYREVRAIYQHLKVYAPQSAKTLLPLLHEAVSRLGDEPEAMSLREWLRYEQGIPQVRDIARMGWSTEVHIEPGEEPGTVLAGAILRWNRDGEELAAPSVLVPLGERRETQTLRAAEGQQVRFVIKVEPSGDAAFYELQISHAGVWMTLHRGYVRLTPSAIVKP